MTEEMQINEIAREMCHLYDECETCQICNEKYPTEDSELCYFQCIAKEIITHNYRKIKCGEWILSTDMTGGLVGGWKCSVCKELSTKDYKYCPECGADMRGKKNA